MEFKLYDSAKNFHEENIEILEKDEAINNIIIFNTNEAIKLENIDNWILARVEENKQVELIIVYRPPHNISFYSPTNNKQEELYEFVAKELYKIDKHILGVMSEKEISYLFAKYYCKMSNQEIILEKGLYILLLEKLNNIELVNANFRKATKEETSTIARICTRV